MTLMVSHTKKIPKIITTLKLILKLMPLMVLFFIEMTMAYQPQELPKILTSLKLILKLMSPMVPLVLILIMVPLPLMLILIVITPLKIKTYPFKSPPILMFMFVKPKRIRSYQVSQSNRYPGPDV